MDKKLYKTIVFTAVVGFCLLFFTSVLGYSKTGNTCYVSSSVGSDTNEGSIDSPFRTLLKAIESGVDTILLKSGDIFYERMDLDGYVVDKYGTGQKPMLCGVKIPQKGAWENGRIEDGKWIKSVGNIWRVDLSLEDDRYSGFKTSGSSLLNNAGAVVNIATDDMNNCRKVPEYGDLTENFDFWQDCPVDDTGSATPKDFDFLYLYFEGNPNEYDFGITMGIPAIKIKNGELRNIKIKYWGYGIDFYDNVRISDCDVDGMGGYIMLGYDKWALLGNGIGSWISAPKRHNCIIENCNVSRTFDCGATIQGHHDKKSIRAEDIVFRNNTFRNCCQTFEEFLRGPEEDNMYVNCIFENNVSIDAGINTGFRYYDDRYKRCHFLSNNKLRNTNMIIRNNIAVNGNYYCAGPYDGLYRQTRWQDNTCKIRRGQDLLGNYRGTEDVITVPIDKGNYNSLEEATDSAISRYRYLTGDQTTKFIIIE